MTTNMTLPYNSFAWRQASGSVAIPGPSLPDPYFSWKVRAAVIAVIVLVTTIGGAFRITIGANGKTPSYTNTQLQRASGVMLQESYHSSAPVPIWTPTNVTVWLNNIKSPERILLDMEVFDASNHRVFQRTWDNVLIQKGKPGVCGITCPGFSMEVPGLMPGTYTVDVGIFKPRWQGGPIRWYDNVETFTVVD